MSPQTRSPDAAQRNPGISAKSHRLAPDSGFACIQATGAFHE